MQVDVTTRMGALHPPTPTGLPILDRLLAGGLRTGSLFSLAGVPGVGKTAFALLLAYMTARAKAATVFVSATLDETEVMARLAARALNREQPELRVTYGSIWNGQAWQDSNTHGPVSAAVDTVVKKVGNLFHVHRAQPFESTASLAAVAAQLWGRHDRVVMVIDGLEAFSASVGGDRDAANAANSGVANRLMQVAYELRQIADGGCAIVTTVQSKNADIVASAATVAADLRVVDGAPILMPQNLLAQGTRPVELMVKKNQTGPTGIVPLRFIAGAGMFEERAP